MRSDTPVSCASRVFMGARVDTRHDASGSCTTARRASTSPIMERPFFTLSRLTRRCVAKGRFACYSFPMAEFDDVLKQLREWAPADDAPRPNPAWFDDLASERQKLVDQRDGAQVLLTEQTTANAAREAEIARLKGENYDLASRIGFKTDEDKGEKVVKEQPHGITGLFEKRIKG